EERGRHREAQRLGSLKIDRQLESCRLLHRQVGRLRSSEDFVHIGRSTSVQFCRIGAIGQKGPGLQQPFRSADQNKSLPCCEIPDLLSVQKENTGPRDDKSLGSLAQCRLERPFKITRLPHLKRLEL